MTRKRITMLDVGKNATSYAKEDALRLNLATNI